MSLHERIRELCKELNVSQTKLAESLGLRQPQFHGYLSKKSEKNLWEYLPRILALYPQVRRDWLYHGEGEMLVGDQPEQPSQPESRPPHEAEEIASIKAELMELRQAFRELLEQNTKLLDQSRLKPEPAERPDTNQGKALRLDEEFGGYSGDGSGVLQEGNPKYLPDGK